MAELQSELLARAADWLKPGGVLVYAVCSLEREEGEDQAAKVALTPDPIRAEELPAGLAPTVEGWLRTDPGMLRPKAGWTGSLSRAGAVVMCPVVGGITDIKLCRIAA
jgi:16S rRNA (cytosine967-C5)-methyltransferase